MWLKVTTADEWQLNEKVWQVLKESFFSQSLKLWSDSAVLKWADRYFYNLFFFLFIYFYLFKVFTKNQALGRIPIVEKKVFTRLVKGPFIFPWNVIQNTPLRPLTTLVERLVFAHYPVHVRRAFFQYCSIVVFTCKNRKAHYNDFLIQD